MSTPLKNEGQFHDSLFGNGAPCAPNEAGFEAALVDALQLQLPGAYEALLRHYERRLLNISLRITKSIEDSEDAVQSTFLQVHRNLHRFRGDSKFTTWLTSIAINQSLMILRRKKNISISIESSAEGNNNPACIDIRATGCNPEELCIRRESASRALSIMSRLGKSSRVVAELHFLGECSTREIGQTLGISVSAVKSRLSRARQDMRIRGSKRPLQGGFTLSMEKHDRTTCFLDHWAADKSA